jgi:hypothetical protein
MKNTLIILIVIALFSCKNEVKQEKGIVENIKSFSKIETYFYAQKKGWELSNAYTFNLPKEGGKLISLFGGIGIDKGNVVEYYSLLQNDRGWKHDVNFDFKKPYSNVNLVPMFGGLAIKKGNKLEYYSLNNKGWKRSSEYDFELPNSNSEFVAMFGGLAIKKGNKLEYYTLLQNNKGWKRSPKFDFEIPSGKDFISFHEHIFFGGLGVFNGETLDFYGIGSKGWKKENELNFSLKNIKQKNLIGIAGGIGILKE